MHDDIPSRFVSTYDHARGARDGALVLGIPAFVLGAVAGGLIASAEAGGCADQCPPPPDPLHAALVTGAVLGLAAAAVGAGLGALVGHEDRYTLGP